MWTEFGKFSLYSQWQGEGLNQDYITLFDFDKLLHLNVELLVCQYLLA